MEYFAGLDVSLDLTAVCVMDGSGRVIAESKAPSEPEALIAHLPEVERIQAQFREKEV